MSKRVLNLIISVVETGTETTVRAEADDGTSAEASTILLNNASIPSLVTHPEIKDWMVAAYKQLFNEKVPTNTIEACQKVGGYLFNLLFPATIQDHFRQKLFLVNPGYGLASYSLLRLRLQLPDHHAVVPWELLYDRTSGRFLVSDTRISLVRAFSRESSYGNLRVNRGPLEIVGLVAEPDGWPFVSFDREEYERHLKQVVERRSGSVEIISGPGTLDRLEDRIQRSFQVLDIMCHGGLLEEEVEGVLIVEDEDRQPYRIGAEPLRNRLELMSQDYVRLVFLKACMSAMPADGQRFGSIGAAIGYMTSPAVIAMQFAISVESATVLTREFYRRLAQTGSVEIALQRARQKLQEGPYHNQLDRFIPVLYFRADDGQLFSVEEEIRPGAIDIQQRPSEKTLLVEFVLEQNIFEDNMRRRDIRGPNQANELFNQAREIEARIESNRRKGVRDEKLLEEQRNYIVKYCRRAVGLYQDTRFYHLAARTLYMAGEYENAFNWCEDAIDDEQVYREICIIGEKICAKILENRNIPDYNKFYLESAQTRQKYFKARLRQINQQEAERTTNVSKPRPGLPARRGPGGGAGGPERGPEGSGLPA